MKLLSMIALLLGLWFTRAEAGLLRIDESNPAQCDLIAARLIENSQSGAMIFPDAPGGCDDSDESLADGQGAEALRLNFSLGSTESDLSIEMSTLPSTVNP